MLKFIFPFFRELILFATELISFPLHCFFRHHMGERYFSWWKVFVSLVFLFVGVSRGGKALLALDRFCLSFVSLSLLFFAGLNFVEILKKRSEGVMWNSRLEGFSRFRYPFQNAISIFVFEVLVLLICVLFLKPFLNDRTINSFLILVMSYGISRYFSYSFRRYKKLDIIDGKIPEEKCFEWLQKAKSEKGIKNINYGGNVMTEKEKKAFFEMIDSKEEGK